MKYEHFCRDQENVFDKYLEKRLVTLRIEKSGLSRVTRRMTRALEATQRMLGTTTCITRVLCVVADGRKVGFSRYM